MFHLKITFEDDKGTRVEFDQKLDLSMCQIMKRLDKIGTPQLTKYALRKHGQAKIHYANGTRVYEIKAC